MNESDKQVHKRMARDVREPAESVVVNDRLAGLRLQNGELHPCSNRARPKHDPGEKKLIKLIRML